MSGEQQADPRAAELAADALEALADELAAAADELETYLNEVRARCTPEFMARKLAELTARAYRGPHG